MTLVLNVLNIHSKTKIWKITNTILESWDSRSFYASDISEIKVIDTNINYKLKKIYVMLLRIFNKIHMPRNFYASETLDIDKFLVWLV